MQIFSKKLNQKGFTLIELLVVIAIIGILSSVTMVGLNAARNKGKDTAIKSSLSQLRSSAEMDFDTYGNYNTVCTESTASGLTADSTLTAATPYSDYLATITKYNVTPVCNESTNSAAYAVWTALPSANTWWCVDSMGVSKNLTTAPAANVTACP